MTCKAPYRFDRYRDGNLMAEGIKINRAYSLEQATQKAAQLADHGDVLVYRPDADALAAAQEEIERLREALQYTEAVMDLPDESKHNKPEDGVYIYGWGRIERAIEKARAALGNGGSDETR